MHLECERGLLAASFDAPWMRNLRKTRFRCQIFHQKKKHKAREDTILITIRINFIAGKKNKKDSFKISKSRTTFFASTKRNFQHTTFDFGENTKEKLSCKFQFITIITNFKMTVHDWRLSRPFQSYYSENSLPENHSSETCRAVLLRVGK